MKVYRQNHVISRTELQLLRIDGGSAVARALIAARGEIARANIQEIADTVRLIDSLPPDSLAIQYAVDQLDHLSRSLRRLLDDF